MPQVLDGGRSAPRGYKNNLGYHGSSRTERLCDWIEWQKSTESIIRHQRAGWVERIKALLRTGGQIEWRGHGQSERAYHDSRPHGQSSNGHGLDGPCRRGALWRPGNYGGGPTNWVRRELPHPDRISNWLQRGVWSEECIRKLDIDLPPQQGRALKQKPKD